MVVKKRDAKEWFDNIYRNRIFIDLFLTGASSLVLEVVATRILSPFFGNTIFNFTSIIAIVLGALSLGYYFGGKIADDHPDKKYFYGIILLASITVIILKYLVKWLLPVFAYEFPLTWGPLVAALVLFSPPSFLLGMLSPFTIKLVGINNKKIGIGKLSGQVFFISTLGSIFGTLVSGFYLIPTFGIDKILSSVAILLLLIAFTGSLEFVKKKFKIPFFLFILIFLSVSLRSAEVSGRNIIYQDDGVYERISVWESEYKGKKARLLLQDLSNSSAVFSDSGELVFDYTKYVDIYKLFNMELKNVLFLGGGAYVMPTYLLKNNPKVKVDVVEIEPQLFPVSVKYFGASTGAGLNNHIEDGRRFLHDSQNKYDLIFSDVYASIYSVPAHFTTVEFFKLSRSHLRDKGIFLANIIGDLSRQDPSLIMSEINTFRQAYPQSYFFAVDSPSLLRTQNIIFLGINSDEPVDLNKLIDKQENVFLKSLNGKIIDPERYDINGRFYLNDNYSPVEILSAELIKHSYVDWSKFQGKETLALIKSQVKFGSREVGSDGHRKVINLIKSEAKTLSDKVYSDSWQESVGAKIYELNNIFVNLFPENKKRILLATHYDSLIGNPGANNSASGVAVLLEIMRVLKNAEKTPEIGVDFIFFDAEEGLPGAGWKPYGSEHFSSSLKNYYKDSLPQSAIVLDMVCDRDLNIYMEKNSFERSTDLTRDFFSKANRLSPTSFYQKGKYSVGDDQIALIKAGIPSTLLIDFDYPFYNTAKDTPDKCSDKSLDIVGNAVLSYIYSL